MYGEWLREQFDKGAIPEPTYDPDLAILLSQLRENSINPKIRKQSQWQSQLQ